MPKLQREHQMGQCFGVVFGTVENLVETLDEMHINKVRGYIVDDQLNIEEQKLLEENKL